MNELLKQKIKSLYQEGHRSVDKILFELNKRGQIIQTRQVNRPLYQMELGFRNIVLSIVGADVQIFMQLSSSNREVFIKNKIDTMFNNAETSEGKIAALKTGLELQNYKALLEKSGSLLFNDPLFAQEFSTEEYYVDGQSWLEQNSISSPSDADVLLAVSS